MKTKIYVGNKVVGYVEGTVFYKKVKGSRHFLKKPPAIAFDVSSLIQAEQVGALTVCVTDTEDHKTYTASLDAIRSRGFLFNRGFGDQIGMPLSYWNEPEAFQMKMEGLEE